MTEPTTTPELVAKHNLAPEASVPATRGECRGNNMKIREIIRQIEGMAGFSSARVAAIGNIITRRSLAR